MIAPRSGVPGRFPLVDQVGPALATPALLDLLRVPTDLRRRLDGGEAIGVGGLSSSARAVQLVSFGEGPEPPTPVLLPLGGAFDSPVASQALPTVVLGADLAARLGLQARPGGVLFVAPSAFTDSQQRALALLSQDLNWETSYTGAVPSPRQTRLETPYRDSSPSDAVVRVVVLALSLLLILAVVAVGLALAATDSEDERQVLAATGVPPKVLRRVATRRATLLVVAAGAIAVPAGLLPAAAIVAAAADSSEGFRLDLWSMAFVAGGLPVLIGTCTAFGTRLRDAARPSRPDVFALAE